MVPFSGGSSVEGNFAAPFGGVSIDFAYMDKVIQFNEDESVPNFFITAYDSFTGFF